MQYYLVFNGAITGLAASLLNPPGTSRQIFSALIFLIGIPACLIGRLAIAKTHEYYRYTIYRKTLIEEQLGLLRNLEQHRHPAANLSVATTAGMRDTHEILQNTDAWLARKHRRWSVVWCFRLLLLALAVVNGMGVIVASWPLSTRILKSLSSTLPL